MSKNGVRDRIKELRRVKASELLPNPKNWRQHPEAQVNALRGLLSEIGYADALLARETPDGLMLIDGHLRAETTPDATVPVLVLDVTEAEADKMLVTLDSLAGMAEVNGAALKALLDEVTTGSESVQELLDDLNAQAKAAMPAGAGGDDFDVEAALEDSENACAVERGQVWVCGGHRVMCGDSTDADDVARLMAGEKARLMITDPPYGVEYDPKWREDAANRGFIGFVPTRKGVIANDDRIDWEDAYRLFRGDVAYCWRAAPAAATVQANLGACGFELRAEIIWSKPSFVISRGHYNWQHEGCWYAVRKGASAGWIGNHSEATIWPMPFATGTNHGAQKPVEAMEHPLRNHSGDVYDPFLGSGTTMIAAERLGRRCYGMEIEPRYVQVALARWEAETGGQAVQDA